MPFPVQSPIPPTVFATVLAVIRFLFEDEMSTIPFSIFDTILELDIVLSEEDVSWTPRKLLVTEQLSIVTFDTLCNRIPAVPELVASRTVNFFSVTLFAVIVTTGTVD